MHHPLKYTCIQEHVQYYVICVIKYHKGWFVESWLNKRNYSLMVSNRWTYLWPGSQTQRDTLEHIYTKGFTCIIHHRIHTPNTDLRTHTHKQIVATTEQSYTLQFSSHTQQSHAQQHNQSPVESDTVSLFDSTFPVWFLLTLRNLPKASQAASSILSHCTEKTQMLH